MTIRRKYFKAKRQLKRYSMRLSFLDMVELGCVAVFIYNKLHGGW